MKHAIVMPALGETMDEGTVVSWRKDLGHSVKKGEVLFEVMTDKATFEVEATQGGYLRSIVAQVEDMVPVGRIVAWMTDTPDEPFGENDDVDDQVQGGVTNRFPVMNSSGIRVPEIDKAVRVSPRARRLLDQHCITIEAVAAFMPGKLIEVSDVEAYLKSQKDHHAVIEPVQGDSGRLVTLSGMRATIARRMAKASEVPQVTLHTHCAVDRMLELHRRAKDRPDHAAVSLTDWIVKAVVVALGRHPDMNAWFEAAGIRRFARVNVGLAIDTPMGLVVPVIRKADGLTLVEIAEQRVRLRNLASAGRLQPTDYGDGTFTVSNLGGYGVDTFTPLLNLPEVGILGVGQLATAVVPDGGSGFKSEQRLALSVTFDHRAVDGGPAAKFLNDVGHLLIHPQEDWV